MLEKGILILLWMLFSEWFMIALRQFSQFVLKSFGYNYIGTSSHSNSWSSSKAFTWKNYDYPATNFTIFADIIIFRK